MKKGKKHKKRLVKSNWERRLVTDRLPREERRGSRAGFFGVVKTGRKKESFVQTRDKKKTPPPKNHATRGRIGPGGCPDQRTHPIWVSGSPAKV